MNSIHAVAIAYLLSALSALANPADLLPQGGTITNGSATISINGSEMSIDQLSDRAIVDWQSFNIGEQAGVTVNQPSSNSAFLARIVGQDAGSILGSLNANGQVYLVNPNGIIFGQNASVSVNTLVASTLDISNTNFMSGIDEFDGSADAGIVLSGSIDSADLTAIVAQDIHVSDATITGGSLALIHATAAKLIRENIGGGGATIDLSNVSAPPTGGIFLTNVEIDTNHVRITSGTTIHATDLDLRGALQADAIGNVDLSFGNRWDIHLITIDSANGDVTLAAQTPIHSVDTIDAVSPNDTIVIPNIPVDVLIVDSGNVTVEAPAGHLLTTTQNLNLLIDQYATGATPHVEVSHLTIESLTDLTIQAPIDRIMNASPPNGGGPVINPTGDVVTLAPTEPDQPAPSSPTPAQQQPTSGGSISLTGTPSATPSAHPQVPSEVQLIGTDAVIPMPEPLTLEALVHQQRSQRIVAPQPPRAPLPTILKQPNASPSHKPSASIPFVGPIAPTRDGHGRISIDFNFD